MLYLIDGYNLLHAMGVLRGRVGPTGLEKARRRLLGLLHGSYGDESCRVTVVFDAANLGTTNTHHELVNPDALVPVANVNLPFQGNTSHLFAEPEGIDFDAAGNLWVANNNDGGFGIRDSRTSLVKITPALQAAVLAAVGPVKPTVGFSIYQVPNLLNDTSAIPQFGGLQVDREAKRIYVNEEVAGKGRGYDIETIETIGTNTDANDLDIVSTNPGNGGIALVNTELLVILV